MHEHLEYLAVKIGPRGSGSAEEEKAATYVLEQLKAYGLEGYKQHFPAAATFSWTYVLLYAFAPAAIAVFRFRPGLAFVISLAGALGYLTEASTYPLFSRLLPKKRSVNAIATSHARSKELRRILVLAHLDSSRSGLSFSPRLVPGFRRSFLLTAAGVFGLAVLYGLAVLVPGAPRQAIWLVSLVPGVAAAVAIGLLLHRELRGVITPGANDNASGVAVMLEVARTITRAPLLTTAVWFAATGAEESGLWGALHLIRENRFDPKKTLVINLDNLGAGRLTLTTGEGMIVPLRAAPGLVEAARATATEKGIDLAFRPYHLLTTDATAFMARRLPAATVMAFDERGLLPNWHWPTDTAERVSETNLIAARDLVLGMIRRLGE